MASRHTHGVNHIDRVVEYVRSSFWVIPAVSAVLSVAAGFGLVAVDRTTTGSFGFTGGAEAARSVLSTIAAAMITFTGLVFSITIVALQLASSQFSPRVMRTFLRDNASKVALATFVATFSFAFTVLRATRTDDVPGISVNLAIILVFVSVGVFIHYINHTAHAIRASAIIDSVAAETRDSIERCHPAEPAAPGSAPELSGKPLTVRNERGPGVVTGFDAQRIVSVARAAGAIVVLRVGVGDFVPRDGALLDLYGAEAEDCAVAACVSLGRERTMQQDPAFGLRQLVDLAARALSPGVNDPTTAVQAIDQLHDALRRLAVRPMHPGRVADDDGVVRLVLPVKAWEDFVSLAVDEIRIYGAGSLQVLRRLRGMLDDLLDLTEEARHPPLREQLRLLTSAAEREFPDERDRRVAGLGDAQGLGS